MLSKQSSHDFCVLLNKDTENTEMTCAFGCTGSFHLVNRLRLQYSPFTEPSDSSPASFAQELEGLINEQFPRRFVFALSTHFVRAPHQWTVNAPPLFNLRHRARAAGIDQLRADQRACCFGCNYLGRR